MPIGIGDIFGLCWPGTMSHNGQGQCCVSALQGFKGLIDVLFAILHAVVKILGRPVSTVRRQGLVPEVFDPRPHSGVVAEVGQRPVDSIVYNADDNFRPSTFSPTSSRRALMRGPI